MQPLTYVKKSRGSVFHARLGMLFFLFLFCSGAAFAQIDRRTQPQMRPENLPQATQPNTIRQAPARGVLNRQLLQINSRRPLTFKPFDLVDPRTNRPISPTTVIVLPNGKRPTAKQYYDELNTLERWLSDHGYSLHSTPAKAQIQLHEVVLNRALIDRQIQMSPRPSGLSRNPNFRAQYSVAGLSAVRSIRLEANQPAMSRVGITPPAARLDDVNRRLMSAGVQGSMRDGMVVSYDALAKIASLRMSEASDTASNSRDAQARARAAAEAGKEKAKEAAIEAAQAAAGNNCVPLSNSKSWNWNVGDPASFTAYVNGTLSLSGRACEPPDMTRFENNKSNFTLTADGRAGGTIFGVGGEMLRTTASLGGNQATSTVSAGLGVFVLGQNVFSVNKTASTHWQLEQPIAKGVDFSSTVPVPVGPFDIDVTVGAQGSVGMEYSITLYPMSVNLSGGPFVHTNVYAQATLNLVAAEAGAVANLPLLNWDMNLGGATGVGWMFGFYAYGDVYADSTFNALNGSVYAYEKVYYPCFDPGPDICDSQWRTTLWSWPGLKYDGVLFDEKKVLPLHW